MLTPEMLPRVQQALADAGLDGWLLYDFRGTNPIAASALGLQGMVSRRVFALIPREGTPVAVTHAIEQGQWRDWPPGWRREIYSSWRSLEALVRELVGGRRVAMEYSPGDAVPYFDRVPAGVLDLVRDAGATVVPSGELVTRFFAVWDDAHLASHRRAAAAIAAIAHDAFHLAGARARAGAPVTEWELMQWILARFHEAGLETDHGPNVSANGHAANPHYEPGPEGSFPLRAGDLVLIDLWAYESSTPGRERGVWADQTWMGVLGAPTPRMQEVWAAVRDARDAAIALLRERLAAGRPVRGAEVDDAARRVIEARGFGPAFFHRTGHSIDPRELHGAGPHLDNLETREERQLVPGAAFSIEPGVYLPDEGIGVRAEVNALVTPEGLVVTPDEVQRDLIVA